MVPLWLFLLVVPIVLLLQSICWNEVADAHNTEDLQVPQNDENVLFIIIYFNFKVIHLWPICGLKANELASQTENTIGAYDYCASIHSNVVDRNETIHNLLKFIKVLLSVDISSQPINVKEFMQVTIGVYDVQYTASVTMTMTYGERTKLRATGSLQVQMKSRLVGNVFLQRWKWEDGCQAV